MEKKFFFLYLFMLFKFYFSLVITVNAYTYLKSIFFYITAIILTFLCLCSLRSVSITSNTWKFRVHLFSEKNYYLLSNKHRLKNRFPMLNLACDLFFLISYAVTQYTCNTNTSIFMYNDFSFLNKISLADDNGQ